jgi:hypothetical protein
MVVACTHDIKVYREKHAHPLWDLLLNELDRALKTLKFPHMYHRNISKQHGAYLGMMRGTSSQPVDEMPSDHYNIFSNGVQHTLSHELTREVTQSFGSAAVSLIEPTGGSSMSFAAAVSAANAVKPRPQRKGWSHYGGLSLTPTKTSAASGLPVFPESTFMWNGQDGTQPQ